MRHGIQLAGITRLWLADMNKGWDCLSCNMTDVNFRSFSEATDSPLAQPKWEANLPAIRAVQRDCESV